MIVQPRLTGIFTPSDRAVRELTARKYERLFQNHPPRTPRQVYAEEAELVKLQRDACISLITDGQALWGDLLRPVYYGMEGVKVGSQTRWFKTNGFVFPPRIVGLPQPSEAFPAEKFIYAGVLGGSSQVTLAGPYTLLTLAENLSRQSDASVLGALIGQYKSILNSLPGSVQLVEFCEQSLGVELNKKSEVAFQRLGLVVDAYAEMAKAMGGRVSILQLPQTDFNSVAPYVSALNVDGFGVDLLETVEPLPSPTIEGKILSAGIVNAYSSESQSLDFSVQRVNKAIEAWRPQCLYVTSNAQLYQTVHRQAAVKKVGEMAEIVRRLS